MANGEFEMKITKRQLRRIIKEEKAREFPIHLYSREELLQEGLFDFLGKMWGKLKGVMQKGYDKATASVKSAYSDAMKGVDASKLDPKKPDTYKDLALKWGTIDAESLSKINEWLDKAADIENWTPPLDDADQEASTNLWKSVGALQEMVKGWSQYVDGVGLDKTKGSPENPAEATMWCGELLGEVIDVWEWLYKNVKADHVEKSAKSISEYAKSLREFLHDINIQIKTDAEEQQNEWIDLRYTVGGMLSEKRQLRRIVKEEVANKQNLYLDQPNKSRGYMSGNDVTWTGEDSQSHIYNWYKDMNLAEAVEELVREYYLDRIAENTGVAIVSEALDFKDKKDIQKMIKNEMESREFRREIDRSFKKNFDKELQATLGVSYFGTPGKVNKFVVDEIHDEVGKILKHDVTREMIGDICKKVMITLYKDLSFSYPQVIKRIKV
jgi:hypothetical protein